MDKNKENAVNDYITMIKNSWTYDRMTAEEKDRCIESLTDSERIYKIQGTYRQRWTTLHAVYNAFLSGIGYDGFNWRETA